MGTDSLVLVANRLPWTIGSDGLWRGAPGGLISALHPIAHQHRTTWVGLAASASPDTAVHVSQFGGDRGRWPCACTFADVHVPAAIADRHYNGTCNTVLWPTYHDGMLSSAYSDADWHDHRLVTDAFADVVCSEAPLGATVWIHDYHLQLLPRRLRQRRRDLSIGFFLHVPFPPPEIFMRLPWRQNIIDGLRHAHVIGFQTSKCMANFRRAMAMTARAEAPWMPSADPLLIANPASVDVHRLRDEAVSPAVQAEALQLRQSLGSPEHLLLGIDRLDYTKGLVPKVEAVASLLDDGSLDAATTVFLQIAAPSRLGTPAYASEGARIHRAFGAAIGSTSTAAYQPIRLQSRGSSHDDLIAYFAAADAMLVTPLRDGMNLVAKEFAAIKSGMLSGNPDSGPALVLSEFAGAAYELADAYLVNPYSQDSMRAGIMHALHDPVAERRRRMARNAEAVGRHTTYDWAQQFLETLARRTETRVIDVRAGTKTAV